VCTEWTYSLRTLACKRSRLLYLWSLIIIMRHYGCDYMLFFYIDLDRCYWLGSPECAGFGPQGCLGIDETLGIWIESGSGLLGFDFCIYMKIVHLIRWYDYSYNFWDDLFMMQVEDNLPTRLTCGGEGSCTITNDIEGEVWTESIPHPTSIPVVARTVG